MPTKMPKRDLASADAETTLGKAVSGVEVCVHRQNFGADNSYRLNSNPYR